MIKKSNNVFPVMMLILMLLMNVCVSAEKTSVIITTSDTKKTSATISCIAGTFQGGALECGSTGIHYDMQFRKTKLSGWTTFEDGSGTCKPNKTFGPVYYKGGNGTVFARMVLKQVKSSDPGAGWGRIDYD